MSVLLTVLLVASLLLGVLMLAGLALVVAVGLLRTGADALKRWARS